MKKHWTWAIYYIKITATDGHRAGGRWGQEGTADQGSALTSALSGWDSL